MGGVRGAPNLIRQLVENTTRLDGLGTQPLTGLDRQVERLLLALPGGMAWLAPHLTLRLISRPEESYNDNPS
jgi:hypothetical protein